ncbi:MAG: undecaprenyl-diphosphatase UppP [Patescibacteria group bacterium]|jgi:undecaprenyl-diphosphatase
MNYLLAILAGLIQGVAEFLPISSSGHLVLLHEILRFNLPDNLTFDVVLHLGTFSSLLVFFWRDIIRLIKGFFSSLVKWNLNGDSNQRLAWLIIIGTIPAVLAGYFFNDFIEQVFHEGRSAALVVAIMLIVVAVLFWLLEKYAKRLRAAESLKWWESLIIGAAQATALIPGTSRSGITICAGLMLKLTREQAAKFSFLLSLPVVLGAGVKSLLQIESLTVAEWPLLAVGFVTAAVSGYFAVKFLLKYLLDHSLGVFAWYRVILAGLILLWLVF